MGSCVSKKAARAGAAGKAAAPLPAEKENVLPLPAPTVVVEEEEVKEVLSETAVVRHTWAPEPEKDKEKEMVKKRQEREEDEEESSECASVASTAAEKAKAKAAAGEEKIAAVDGVREKGGKERRRAAEQRKPKDAGNGRARSPSPASAQRRQVAGGGGNSDHPPLPRPRREQPAVVSGFGCRSGRFSPSAARRAAESAAVRRTNSAREADMALPPAKRSLNAAINGNAIANGGGSLRRDPGERFGRRPDSPTYSKRPPASPAANGAIHRQSSTGAGATRKATKESSNAVDQTKPQCGGGGRTTQTEATDEAALAGGEQQKEGELGQNPSVAMECFIFL